MINLLSIAVLIGFVAACFLAAATGILFKPGDWYERLKKPGWTVLYLMIPYLAWVSFASLLNFAIWRLNRD